MQNFNTNQARYLYVAGAIDANLDTNLDIISKQLQTGEFYFMYKNADGLITRSDTIDPKKVKCMTKKGYADLATKLVTDTITLKTTNYADLAAIKGKTLKLSVTFLEVVDYDSTRTFCVEYKVPSSAANLTAVYAAFEDELKKVIPAAYADIDSSASGITITEKAQKWVRGKLSADPIPFEVAFGVAGDNEPEWGSVAKSSSSTLSGSYKLADLEYFAAGEKGDYYRGSMWPNDYPFTPAVDVSATYDVLSIEYYWAGNAENVQKSPRLIQIAAPSSGTVVNTLYTTIKGYLEAPYGSGSGGGTGA